MSDDLELAWDEETEEEYLARTRKWSWRRRRADEISRGADAAYDAAVVAGVEPVTAPPADAAGVDPEPAPPAIGVPGPSDDRPGGSRTGAGRERVVATIAAAGAGVAGLARGLGGGVRRGASLVRARGGGPTGPVPPGGSSGPQAFPPKKETRFALIASLALLLVVGVLGWAGASKFKGLFGTEDYRSTRGSSEVTVQIKSGQSATEIAMTLRDAGVVKSAKAFIGAANDNPDSRKIEVGYYKLPKEISAKAALDRLLARDKAGALINRVVSRITIPEGTISVDVFQKLSEFTKIPVAAFVKAAKDPGKLGLPDWWLTREDGKKMLNPPSIEGFLFPDTYELAPNSTAEDILGLMINHFLTVTGDLRFAENVQKNLRITPYEALVAASIAQVEAVFDEDMAGIARVLYNRAYTDDFPCKCLGLDSEVNYWLRITGQKAQPSGDLRDRQLHDPKDPYNTHDLPGLPVGPISNPGKAALIGAMNPPKSNNFYFLGVDTKGHTAFARSYEEFCQLVNQAAANGVSIGTCE